MKGKAKGHARAKKTTSGAIFHTKRTGISTVVSSLGQHASQAISHSNVPNQQYPSARTLSTSSRRCRQPYQPISRSKLTLSLADNKQSNGTLDFSISPHHTNNARQLRLFSSSSSSSRHVGDIKASEKPTSKEKSPISPSTKQKQRSASQFRNMLAAPQDIHPDFIDFAKLSRKFERVDIDYAFVHSRNVDAIQIAEDIKWTSQLLSDHDRRYRLSTSMIQNARQSRPALFFQEYREMDLIFSKTPELTGMERVLVEHNAYTETLAALRGSFEEAAQEMAVQYPTRLKPIELPYDYLVDFIQQHSTDFTVEKLRAFLTRVSGGSIQSSGQLTFNLHAYDKKSSSQERTRLFFFESLLKAIPDVTTRVNMFDFLIQNIDFYASPSPKPSSSQRQQQSNRFQFEDPILNHPYFSAPFHVQSVLMHIRKFLSDKTFTEKTKNDNVLTKYIKPASYEMDRFRLSLYTGNYHEMEALALLGVQTIFSKDHKSNIHLVHLIRNLPTAHLVLKNFLRFSPIPREQFRSSLPQIFDNMVPTLEYYETVKEILGPQGFNVNQPGNDGSTPFLQLMSRSHIDNHLPLVKRVLEDKADIFSTNSRSGMGALHSLARVEGTFNVMLLLAEHGCTMKEFLKRTSQSKRGLPQSPTPVHFLLQDYRPFNSQDLSDRLTLLLGHDTDFPSASSIGTLYELASTNPQVSVDAFYTLAIRHVAAGHSMNDIDSRLRHPVMYHSIAMNNNAKLQIIFDLKGDPNMRDVTGKSALMYALTQIVNRETLVTLFGANANPNICDHQGRTSLHYAMSSKDVDHVQFLLTMKADPNIPDKQGLVPLCYYNGTNMPVLNSLRKIGADLNAVDSFGNTYLMRMVTLPAIKNPQWFFPAIKRLGLNPHVRNKQGLTVLQLALPEYRPYVQQLFS